MRIGQIVTVKNVTILNDMGATAFLDDTILKAKIVHMFYDYEVGYRFYGELIEKDDIEYATRIGTTGFTPDDYKKHGEKRYREKLISYKEFNPKRVYFSEHRIIKIHR